MANQAAKKREIKKENVSVIYLQVMQVLAALKFLSMFIDGSFTDIYAWLYYAFLQIVSYSCYNSIYSSLELGLDVKSYGYSNDTFIINSIVQFGSIFSDKFWYLYLVFPAYLFYYLFGMCWGYLDKMTEPDPTQQNEVEQKKKERVKYVKY